MKSKSTFFCRECGNETAKWAGRCTSCGAWNSLEEAPSFITATAKNIKHTNLTIKPQKLSELDDSAEVRFSTGINELDRVLGGGAVRGSIILVGGAPGIGKSTLLLQICGNMNSQSILYVSGEESLRQIKLRAHRLGVCSDNVNILAETDISVISSCVQNLKPDVLIIDSVQTMFNAELSAAPGSITQVKFCTTEITRLSKTQELTAFIVGHINKDGAIAGPKVLEHMVDCVLYFEGDRALNYRILRAAKNRFGSTNELGVFEMNRSGLREVTNPSEIMLAGRPKNAPGTCVACTIQGTRPILAEIQALISPSGMSQPRRASSGIDVHRTMLLLAVIEKRGGIHVSTSDAYINVIGGLELDEPAVDLPIVLSIASSYRDCPIGEDLAAIGEVGLTGEIRTVSGMNERLQEISRLGFKRCVIPAHCKDEIQIPAGLQILPVKTIRDAINAIIV